MGKVTQIKSADELEAQLSAAGNKLVVINFSVVWIDQCKEISPVIEKMAEELADSVVFLNVDVDQCQQIAEDYHICNMPSFKFIKEKKEVDKFSGVDEAKIKELVETHM